MRLFVLIDSLAASARIKATLPSSKFAFVFLLFFIQSTKSPISSLKDWAYLPKKKFKKSMKFKNKEKDNPFSVLSELTIK